MLRAAVIFFVLAIVAYAFGAGGVAGISAEAGKMFLIGFLVLAAISLIGGLINGRKTGLPRV